jgi:histidine triad (HIT) family protein
MRWMMRVARSRWGGRVAGWLFAKMCFALPVKRLLETDRVLAFEHPTPAYRVHILIVPKKQIEGLEQVTNVDRDLLSEVFFVARQLVEKLGLDEYRVIVNGGANQEVKQLHFHLVAGVPTSQPIS